MKFDAIKSLGSVDPQRIYQGIQPEPTKPSFAESLKQAIAEVDSLQHKRDSVVEGMITGEVSEVHDVMAAAEEAQLAFELLLEVRNRLLESYQEIMRMQV